MQKFEDAEQAKIAKADNQDPEGLQDAKKSLQLQMTRLIANLKIGHFAAVDQLLADLQPRRHNKSSKSGQQARNAQKAAEGQIQASDRTCQVLACQTHPTEINFLHA